MSQPRSVVRTFEIAFHFAGKGGWEARCLQEDLLAVRRARTLASGRAAARRALAEAYDCPEDAVALQETYVLPRGISEILERARTARRQAEECQRRSVEATREAVTRLAAEVPEMGMRDIAALVGVSYQRVQQLLSGR